MAAELFVFKDAAEVAAESARRFAQLQALHRRGERFSIALSGGSSPQEFYSLLTTPAWRDAIDWQSLHIFLADERCLPLDHPDSNFRMIRETLLEPLADALGEQAIPPANIHPMPTDGAVEQCAQRYEAELKGFFGDQAPKFDLIILGMGPDGHTASLFPGHTHPKGPWVLPVHDSPKPPPTRLSLSLALINQAHHAFFLVTGADKAEILRSVRLAEAPILPAGRIKLDEGELVWLVDETAAALIAR